MSQAQSAQSLEASLSEATQAALPAIIMDARRAAFAIVAGEHGKRRAGAGDTFWQHREWVNGESVRQIDWRRSARSDKVFVREREWQVPAHLQIWCDHRAGMNWHSDPQLPTKAQRGLVAGLALGLAARNGAERVSVLQSAPSGTAMMLTDELLFAHNLALAGLSAPFTSKAGQVIMLSDGLEDALTWQKRAQNIVAARAQLMVVLIADPAEANFPFEGRVCFQSSGPVAPITIGRAQNARDDYQKAYQAHITQVCAAIEQSGGQVFRHQTDQALLPLLIKLAAALAGSTRFGVAGSK